MPYADGSAKVGKAEVYKCPLCRDHGDKLITLLNNLVARARMEGVRWRILQKAENFLVNTKLYRG